jgi:single-stranded-DNA-specific exonuclease
MLAGVGVAFKLICAVDGEKNTEKLLNRYGDLVAVGTVADVMPMTGENRFYVTKGVELIRQGTRPGLKELCTAAGVENSKVSVTGIGFTLAPRINAAGRLGGTDVAVNLLLSQNSKEASDLAQTLCDLNRERQRIEGEMLTEALAMLEENPPEGKTIVLAGEGWHQGVAGIVASRVSEKFGLPTVMICVKDGIGRGSCRSGCGYNIFEALQKCSDILTNFGGHEMAAGLTVGADRIDELRARLGDIYLSELDKISEPELKIDFEVIKPELMSVQNIDALTMLEPYGIGNPQPTLCMRDMTVENLLPLSDGKHTKAWLSKNGTIFEAVCFGKSIKDLGAKIGGHADVAFIPQINEFRGRRTVQLYMVDFVSL